MPTPTVPTQTYGALAWGDNRSSQLGIGDTTDRSTYQHVSGRSAASAIGAGWYFSLAMVPAAA